MSRLFDDALNQNLVYAGAILTGTPITLACWFMSDSTALAQHLVSLGVNGSTTNWFHLDARGDFAGDNVIAATKDTGGVSYAQTTTGYSLNTWHHACGVFASATDRRSFLDGGSKGTNTTSRTPSGINSARIGNEEGATSEDMSGRIAEVGIWNATLTDDEVAALARGVRPFLIRPDALAAYIPIWGDTDPEPDMSPSIVTATRYNFALNGTPAKADHAPVTLWTPKWVGIPLADVAAGGGDGLMPGQLQPMGIIW